MQIWTTGRDGQLLRTSDVRSRPTVVFAIESAAKDCALRVRTTGGTVYVVRAHRDVAIGEPLEVDL